MLVVSSKLPRACKCRHNTSRLLLLRHYLQIQSIEKPIPRPYSTSVHDATKVSKSGSELPPHSILPTKLLARSLLVSMISSKPALLFPALKLLSWITTPRISLLNVEKNPLLHAVLKKTFYEHFCAGENATEVKATINGIKKMGFKGVILTYAKEIVIDASRHERESGAHLQKLEAQEISPQALADIESWRSGVLHTLSMAGENDFLALKFTGAGVAVMDALKNREPLPEQMTDAIVEICSQAKERDIRILVDAEQQSVQPSIDNIALDLMRRFNVGSDTAVVYNTYQSYLKSTPATILNHMETAFKEGFRLGAKVVRGAYINSEPRHLIHDTKPDTDACYNSIISGIIRRQYGTLKDSSDSSSGDVKFPAVDLFLATHNKESAVSAFELQRSQDELKAAPVNVQYGQLLGMADGVSFGLLQLRGHNGPPSVYKCLSWGTVADCLSYLTRRAVENRDAVIRSKEEYLALRAEAFRRIRSVFRLTSRS